MPKQNGKDTDATAENSKHQAKKLDDVSAKKTKDTECNSKPETIVIAGSARLPENAPASHLFGCLTIELEINPADKTIVDLSCVSVPFLGEKILRKALLGNKIDEGIEGAITQLSERFFNITKRAVIAALEDAYRWYKKSLEKKQ